MVSIEAFEKMNYYIWIKVNNFLKHLHSNKGWNWIIEKYFPIPKEGNKHHDKWILTDPETGNQLKQMRWTNVDKRHIINKHNYSPYDSSKLDYFINRNIMLAKRFR